MQRGRSPVLGSQLAMAGRDLGIAVRAIWLNVVLFVGLVLAGAAAMRLGGACPQAEFFDLVVDSFHMAHLERVTSPGDGALPALLTFVMPVLSLVIVGEGVLRVVAIYLGRRQRRGEWDLMVVKTYAGHTVICGVGELGRAVYRRIMARDPNAHVVLVDTRADILAELGLAGPNVCLIQSDMTSQTALEAANCRAADLIIIASGNDGANLEAGFKAFQLNQRADIWIRLYRSGLADLMDTSTKPTVHFFCPYERAAEALVARVLDPGAGRVALPAREQLAP